MPDYFVFSTITESGLAWFVFGVALLLIELRAPGFLAIFFAAGAWMTAVFLWLGIINNTWGALAVFLVTSLLSLAFLRQRLKGVVGGKVRADANTDAVLDDFVGNICTVVEPIDPQRHTGKVEFRGTQWDARAETSTPVGARVQIQSRINLTLFVKPVEE
jgi:membrane protein implicated in regulation of membrane protease activity